MPDHILILGGTSDIAHAAARLFAAEGAAIALVGRDEAALARVAADLNARGAAPVATCTHDLSQVDESAFVEWAASIGHIDTVLLAYGILGDQESSEDDPAVQDAILDTNFVSAAGWLNIAARYLASRSGGTLAVIGSVAGDRARPSNYIYGSSKAALAFYAEGLRVKLADANVRVVLIKPGLTRSSMTQDLDTAGPLWSDASRVGAQVFRAIRRAPGTIYSPGYWRWVMAVIRLLPGRFLRRL